VPRLSPAAKTSLEAVSVFGFNGNQGGVEEFPLRHDHQVEARRDLVSTEDLSNQSFSSVSYDRASQLLRRGNPKPPDREVVGENEECGETPVNSGAVLIDPLKISAAPDVLVRPEATHGRPGRDGYSLLTVRRLRPFARRRFRTIRPFLVLIRTRKPCARRRRRLFGWNVRLPFIVCSGAGRLPVWQRSTRRVF